MTIKLRKLLSIAVFALLTPTQTLLAEAIPLDRVAAVVNEGIVMQSELTQRIAITKEQLSARKTQLPPEHILRKQVLNRLILESIQKQMASRQGIRISDGQLNGALGRIASQNGLSIEQFREALIAEGRDYKQAREQIRNELLINSVQQNFVNRRIRVTEQELNNFLNSENGKAELSAEYSLGHILIATPSQASPEIIQAAEKSAHEVYNKLESGADFSQLAVEFSNAPNALKGGDLGWRKAAELPETLGDAARKLSPAEFSKPIRSPSGFHIILMKDKRGGAVQLVEQLLVSHILLKPSEIRTSAQAKRQINQLSQRIQSGEEFTSIAKEYSDDSASGSEGGSLGWTQNGQMVPEFEQVMNNTPIGHVSAPFESRFGWHILTVLDKRTQDLGEEMQESRARAVIQKRKFNEELTNWLREIHSQAYIDIKE
ncbi:MULTISPECIES: peptidylprolyl isomerase [unclassified Neptuniibacter]|uniref:peptidylprolyl isomerase n=1 Tax=unclassified Neptuniibacter TaxID=2630693 RepID=UPI0025E53D35|nr:MULTISPECIES: peptidylprolyl isomerase [unclassified Neptuniibacter]|tara:strand:- start:15167 stop:16459 length:1293 start_codon:yes stop_codon:yes gene_type:complete